MVEEVKLLNISFSTTTKKLLKLQTLKLVLQF